MTTEHTLGDRIRTMGVVSWSIIGIALVLYGFFKFLIGPISVVFAPLAIALLVTYLLSPLVGILVRRGVPRVLAVLGIYILFLAVVGVVLAFLVPVIARQIQALIDNVPGYAQTIIDGVNRFAADRNMDFRLDVTRADVERTLVENREAIISFLGGVGSVAGQIVHIVAVSLIGMILSIYLLIDLPKIQRAVTNAMPEDRRDELRMLLEKVGGALGGFFRGQLMIAAFVGVASAIGLTLVGLPYAVLIGLLAGIFNLVPMIGPFLAAIPAIAVGLLSDTPLLALWAVLILFAVQQVDNHVVSPNVMRRTVRLHPITVMIALLVGATLAGILGMLVVIPGVAAAKIVIAYLWDRRHHLGIAAEEPVPEGGPAT